MTVIELILFMWIVGVICIWIMKKLQPETHIMYSIYVLAVLIICTTVVVLHVYQLI